MWLDEICSHMKLIQRPKGYWTFERCKEVASKYTSKKEFLEEYSGAFDKMRDNGWLDEFFPRIK